MGRRRRRPPHQNGMRQGRGGERGSAAVGAPSARSCVLRTLLRAWYVHIYWRQGWESSRSDLALLLRVEEDQSSFQHNQRGGPP